MTEKTVAPAVKIGLELGPVFLFFLGLCHHARANLHDWRHRIHRLHSAGVRRSSADGLGNLCLVAAVRGGEQNASLSPLLMVVVFSGLTVVVER